MNKQTEALKLALEALEYISSHYMSLPKIGCMALAAVEEALAEQPAQQEPGRNHWEDGDVFERIAARKKQPAQQQEPVACRVCNEVHTILDADDSKIIRNAADGYPDGRASRLLTLQERVTALCVYAADWRRWCLEKENAPPAIKPLTDEQRNWIVATCPTPRHIIDTVEKMHGIKERT